MILRSAVMFVSVVKQKSAVELFMGSAGLAIFQLVLFINLKKGAVSRIYPMQVLPPLLMIIPQLFFKIKSFSILCDNLEAFEASRFFKLIF